MGTSLDAVASAGDGALVAHQGIVVAVSRP